MVPGQPSTTTGGGEIGYTLLTLEPNVVVLGQPSATPLEKFHRDEPPLPRPKDLQFDAVARSVFRDGLREIPAG